MIKKDFIESFGNYVNIASKFSNNTFRNRNNAIHLKVYKKGIMQSWVLAIIILIASFVIILLFYNVAFGDFQGNINKKACRTSVEMRDTFNNRLTQISTELIPLDCQTEQICLTNSDDYKCEDKFGKLSNDNKIKIIKLDKDNESARRQILDVYSQALYDCHWQMGEGKMNFLPKGFGEINYCTICSDIVVDEKRIELLNKITNRDLAYYLSTKNENGISFLDFVYGLKDPEDYTDILNKVYNEKNPDNRVDYNQLPITNKNENLIFSQITTKGTWFQKFSTMGVVGVGVGATVGVVALPFIAGFGLIAAIPMVSTGIVVGSAATTIIGTGTFVVLTPRGMYYTKPTIAPKDSEFISKFQCQSYQNLPA